MSQEPPQQNPFAPSPGFAPPPGQERLVREDEFTREPTQYTRQLQLVIAAYLLLSALAGFGLSLVYRDQLRTATFEQMKRQMANSGSVTPEDLQRAVDFALTIGLVFSVIIGVLVIGLAALSLARPRTWVFIVDLVFVGLGGLRVFSGPGGGPMTPGALGAIQFLISLIALAIFAAALVALIRIGPWAMRKVPATI